MYSKFTSMLLCCLLAVVSVVSAVPLSANVRLDGENGVLEKREQCTRDNAYRMVLGCLQDKYRPIVCAPYLSAGDGGSKTVTQTVTATAVTVFTTVTSTTTVGTTTTIAGKTETVSATTTVTGTATVTMWQFKRQKERRDASDDAVASLSSACLCYYGQTPSTPKTATTTVGGGSTTSTVVRRTTSYVVATKTAPVATVTNTSTVSSMTTVTVRAWVTGVPAA
ncbi:hypothetical protein TWF696_007974 [Orbilia brochopaga]|uniref:Uncharacterized protein n=1 Tax=Orbilia brochopaga TaxID=3140254 RepID=A0AAV9UQ71_9PEZI